MTVSKINILLTALGITHQQIADAIGLTQSMVTMTIKGDRTSRNAQDLIAKYICDQITVEALFGGSSEPSPQQEKGLRSKRKRADLNY